MGSDQLALCLRAPEDVQVNRIGRRCVSNASFSERDSGNALAVQQLGVGDKVPICCDLKMASTIFRVIPDLIHFLQGGESVVELCEFN